MIVGLALMKQLILYVALFIEQTFSQNDLVLIRLGITCGPAWL
jgi:hypothetical protein